MSRSNHTDITIVLDRSGSMKPVAADTIGGYNRFLEDQKKAPGTATFTLNQFDDKYERHVDAQDIALVFPLSSETFVPRGMTALLDAIGESIKDTGRRLRRMPEELRPGKVIMVIMTDGEENASHKFEAKKIHEMIAHQREKYAWEFVFLGANQDAITVGKRYGFSLGNTMTYVGNTLGTTSAFNSMSHNTTLYRSGVTADMAFTSSDRDAQTDAGV